MIVRKDDVYEGDGKPMKLSVELLTDSSFRQAFDDSSKSLHTTKTYQSVQTCLKSKRGLGEPFIVKFYAPMDMKDTASRIEYNFKSLGDDVELIQND